MDSARNDEEDDSGQQSFEQLKNVISRELDEAEEFLGQIATDPVPYESALENLQALHSHAERSTILSAQITRLDTAGKTFLESLQSEENEVIQNDLSRLKERFNKLYESVMKKLIELTDNIFQSLIQKIIQEKKFYTTNLLSLDKDTFDEQFEPHDTIPVYVEGICETFSQLDKSGCFVSNIDHLYRELGILKEHHATWKKVYQQLEQLSQDMYQLEWWEVYCQQLVDSELNDRSLFIAALSSIQDQRREKKKHLTSIDTLSEDLLKISGCSDREYITDLVKDAHDKWFSISEILLKPICSMVEEELSICSKLCDDWDKQLTGAETPSTDVSTVTQQYKDYQPSFVNFKDKSESIKKFMSEVFTVVRQLEVEGYSSLYDQWGALQESMPSLIKRGKDRLSKLQKSKRIAETVAEQKAIDKAKWLAQKDVKEIKMKSNELDQAVPPDQGKGTCQAQTNISQSDDKREMKAVSTKEHQTKSLGSRVKKKDKSRIKKTKSIHTEPVEIRSTEDADPSCLEIANLHCAVQPGKETPVPRNPCVTYTRDDLLKIRDSWLCKITPPDLPKIPRVTSPPFPGLQPSDGTDGEVLSMYQGSELHPAYYFEKRYNTETGIIHADSNTELCCKGAKSQPIVTSDFKPFLLKRFKRGQKSGLIYCEYCPVNRCNVFDRTGKPKNCCFNTTTEYYWHVQSFHKPYVRMLYCVVDMCPFTSYTLPIMDNHIRIRHANDGRISEIRKILKFQNGKVVWNDEYYPPVKEMRCGDCYQPWAIDKACYKDAPELLQKKGSLEGLLLDGEFDGEEDPDPLVLEVISQKMEETLPVILSRQTIGYADADHGIVITSKSNLQVDELVKHIQDLVKPSIVWKPISYERHHKDEKWVVFLMPSDIKCGTILPELNKNAVFPTTDGSIYFEARKADIMIEEEIVRLHLPENVQLMSSPNSKLMTHPVTKLTKQDIDSDKYKTLFVSNLSPKTSIESLQQIFTKASIKKPPAHIHSWAFLEFETVEDASGAFHRQGEKLDGFRIFLEYASGLRSYGLQGITQSNILCVSGISCNMQDSDIHAVFPDADAVTIHPEMKLARVWFQSTSLAETSLQIACGSNGLAQLKKDPNEGSTLSVHYACELDTLAGCYGVEFSTRNEDTSCPQISVSTSDPIPIIVSRRDLGYGSDTLSRGLAITSNDKIPIETLLKISEDVSQTSPQSRTLIYKRCPPDKHCVVVLMMGSVTEEALNIVRNFQMPSSGKISAQIVDVIVEEEIVRLYMPSNVKQVTSLNGKLISSIPVMDSIADQLSSGGNLLFVSNLHHSTTECTLKKIFEGVKNITLPVCREFGDLVHGVAFLEFSTLENARKAFLHQGKNVDGRNIYIECALGLRSFGKNGTHGSRVLCVTGFRAFTDDTHLQSLFPTARSVNIITNEKLNQRLARVWFPSSKKAKEVFDSIQISNCYGKQSLVVLNTTSVVQVQFACEVDTSCLVAVEKDILPSLPDPPPIQISDHSTEQLSVSHKQDHGSTLLICNIPVQKDKSDFVSLIKIITTGVVSIRCKFPANIKQSKFWQGIVTYETRKHAQIALAGFQQGKITLWKQKARAQWFKANQSLVLKSNVPAIPPPKEIVDYSSDESSESDQDGYQSTLFISNIPPHKEKKDFASLIKRITNGVVSVKCKSPANIKQQKFHHAIVKYETKRDAQIALSGFRQGKIKLWMKKATVQWFSRNLLPNKKPVRSDNGECCNKLVISNVPANKDEQEVCELIKRTTDGVLSVKCTFPLEKELRRHQHFGIALVEYKTHEEAKIAKQKFEEGKITLWYSKAIVRWSDEDSTNKQTMADVSNRTLVIYNVPANKHEDEFIKLMSRVLKSVTSAKCIFPVEPEHRRPQDFGVGVLEFRTHVQAKHALLAFNEGKITLWYTKAIADWYSKEKLPVGIKESKIIDKEVDMEYERTLFAGILLPGQKEADFIQEINMLTSGVSRATCIRMKFRLLCYVEYWSDEQAEEALGILRSGIIKPSSFQCHVMWADEMGRKRRASEAELSLPSAKMFRREANAAIGQPSHDNYTEELERHDEPYMGDEMRTGDRTKDFTPDDIVRMVDMYIEQGDWMKALETAEQQIPEVLPKYVAAYATKLIEEKRMQDAMDLYVKYGAAALHQISPYLQDKLRKESRGLCILFIHHLPQGTPLIDFGGEINQQTSNVIRVAFRDSAVETVGVVEYENHQCAEEAHQALMTGQARVWGVDLPISWCDDYDIMEKLETLPIQTILEYDKEIYSEPDDELNCTLSIGQVPLNKSLFELGEELRRLTSGVLRVAWRSVQQVVFGYVEYSDLKLARVAHRGLRNGRIKLWGQDVTVCWASDSQIMKVLRSKTVTSKAKAQRPSEIMMTSEDSASPMNSTLSIGYIPPEKTLAEFANEMNGLTAGVVCVAYKHVGDTTNLQGFVEYSSHLHALSAFSAMVLKRIKPWGTEFAVKWAEDAKVMDKLEPLCCQLAEQDTSSVNTQSTTFVTETVTNQQYQTQPAQQNLPESSEKQRRSYYPAAGIDVIRVPQISQDESVDRNYIPPPIISRHSKREKRHRSRRRHRSRSRSRSRSRDRDRRKSRHYRKEKSRRKERSRHDSPKDESPIVISSSDDCDTDDDVQRKKQRVGFEDSLPKQTPTNEMIDLHTIKAELIDKSTTPPPVETQQQQQHQQQQQQLSDRGLHLDDLEAIERGPLVIEIQNAPFDDSEELSDAYDNAESAQNSSSVTDSKQTKPSDPNEMLWMWATLGSEENK